MPQLTNFNALMPLQAFQAGREQRNTRLAGEAQNALMSGDREGAMRLAQRTGNADVMSGLQQQIAQMDEAQRQQGLQNVRATRAAIRGLVQVEEANRPAWIQQNAQLIQQLGLDPAQVAQMPLTNENLMALDRTMQAYDDELYRSISEPYTLGANDTRVDPLTGQQTVGQAGVEVRQEEQRSNQANEALRADSNSIDRMNAGTNAFNAQTNRYEAETGRARLDEDRRQFDQTEARLRTNVERGDPPSQSDIRALRAEFEDEFARPFEDAQDQFLAMADAARDQTGASDIALVFSFFKTIDPASTVREGEFASAANAMGLPARIAQQLERLDNGQLLTPQARQDLISAAENSIRQRYQTVQNAYQRYESLARSSNIDPQMVVRQTSRLPEGRVNVIGENAPTASPPQAIPADDLTNRAGRYLVQ